MYGVIWVLGLWDFLGFFGPKFICQEVYLISPPRTEWLSLSYAEFQYPAAFTFKMFSLFHWTVCPLMHRLCYMSYNSLETNSRSLLFQYPVNFKSAHLAPPSSVMLVFFFFIRITLDLSITLWAVHTPYYAAVLFPSMAYLSIHLSSMFLNNFISDSFFRVICSIFIFLITAVMSPFLVLSSELCCFYSWEWLVSTYFLCNNSVHHRSYFICVKHYMHITYVYSLSPPNSPRKWGLFYLEDTEAQKS